jgi:ATP-dependent Clp protease ATP-binding subunit ClpX
MSEPKNSILRQYQALLEMDKVTLEFDEESKNAIAQKAILRKTGARGLRSIVEELLQGIMFEIPSDYTVEKIIITRDCIEDGAKPAVIKNPNRKPIKLKIPAKAKQAANATA